MPSAAGHRVYGIRIELHGRGDSDIELCELHRSQFIWDINFKLIFRTKYEKISEISKILV